MNYLRLTIISALLFTGIAQAQDMQYFLATEPVIEGSSLVNYYENQISVVSYSFETSNNASYGGEELYHNMQSVAPFKF